MRGSERTSRGQPASSLGPFQIGSSYLSYFYKAYLAHVRLPLPSSVDREVRAAIEGGDDRPYVFDVDDVVQVWGAGGVSSPVNARQH